MKLYIGNKAYSSWSMRPWMALKAAGIPFEEETIWLRQSDTAQRIAAVSANHKVPVLHDGSIVISESIAILEYAAETVPWLWPLDKAARAHARSLSAEMHSGFLPLRQRCPTNYRRKPSPIALAADVIASVDRLVAMWSDCRKRFGSGGDFLFGDTFTNADAMFAPVVNRFHVYAVPVPVEIRRYMEAVMATPMWELWEKGAASEPYSIAEYEAVA